MSFETVHHVGTAFCGSFYAAAANSTEAQLISAEMVRLGLAAQPDRTHVFSLFSQQSQKSIAVSVTPFSSKDLGHEGGLSVSQGGHAQGVVVQLKGSEVTGFTHLAVTGGKLVSSQHSVSDLKAAGGSDSGIKAFAEKIGKIKTAHPLIEVDASQVRSLASIGFNGLLGDPFSHQVHSDKEIAQLRGQTNIVAEIALFVLFRTQGSACCSCSCSCWGSSSCSSSYGG